MYIAHSTAGDLTDLFRGYFDTTSGPKHDAAECGRIAKAIGVPPTQLLFLADREPELDLPGRALGPAG